MSTYPAAKTPNRADSEAALSVAATAALRAPSIFNTQPWRWQIGGEVAELRIDRTRQLPVVDPEGRMATISCGAALHHLLAALAAEGIGVDVARTPDPADRDLLARVRVVSYAEPAPDDVRHYQSLLVRHTDRRPFGRTRVPPETVDALREAAETRGAHLHAIRPDQLTALIVAADRAAAIENADPAYRAELTQWTNRGGEAGDGVPTSTAVPSVPRRVPVRDFTLGRDAGLEPGGDDDSGTTYIVLSADGDDRISWLRSGEALGAILVATVEHGVSTSPMSDLIEVTETRQTLRRILSGIGEPMLVLRVGIGEPATPVPTTPRRPAHEVVERRDDRS